MDALTLSHPLISVITVTWNCADTVADCIQSVKSQDWSKREHLVIDGVSTDGTLDILDAHSSELAALISEPDKGIYDALNKGISLARGDIIGFVHADDIFADNLVLSRVAAAFVDPSVQAVYGDLQYVRKNDVDSVIRHWKSSPFHRKNLAYGWMPPHPTLYLRRSVYDQLGVFNTRYRIAADYDFMLRFFTKPDLKTVYLPHVLVKMRVGGVSNRSISSIIRKSNEDLNALRSNRVGGLNTLIWKNLSKLGQFRLR